MSRTFKFVSLSRPGIAYTIHTDSMAVWDQAYHTAGALNPNWGEYKTYGDGLVQHEYERAVVVRNIADFCASATKFVLSNDWFSPGEDHERSRRDFMYACRLEVPSTETCEFVLGLTYNDTKTVYFNLEARKTSTASNKQYDKRWKEVDRYCDGTIESAYRVLCADEHWAWAKWQTWETLRNVLHDYSASTERKFLGDTSTGAHNAYYALTAAIRMLHAHDSAECELGNWTRNHAPKPESESKSENPDSDSAEA